jgi:hypothetical protein
LPTRAQHCDIAGNITMSVPNTPSGFQGLVSYRNVPGRSQ